MMYGPTSAPTGAGVGPFSARALGLATIALAAVGATGYQFVAFATGLEATNGGWLAFVALAVLGGVMILWDRLTDSFEETSP